MIPERSFRRLGLRLLLLIGALAVPSVAVAQAGTPVDSVIVGLWPEFDRREVLVIYRALLPPGTALPVQVFLPIPGNAPELAAVAYRETGGQLLNATYERIEGDPIDTVVIEAAGIEVQLEYYAPLEFDRQQRSFTFSWPGGLSTSSFGFEVQQPFGAEAMEVTPPASTRTTDSRGLVYHNISIGAIGSQDQPQVSFRYTKADDRLSAEVAAPAALVAPPTSTPSAIDLSSILPYALLLGGFGLIAVGVGYYLRTRQAERHERRRHRPAGDRAGGEREVDASPVFCHNCGAQASASDRYCRRCGTALRG